MKFKKTRIAIFGANSHIARTLIGSFLQDKDNILHLCTRSPDKASSFLKAIGESGSKNYAIHAGYKDLYKNSYDVLINCVGVGTFRKLKGDYTQYFTVTEDYDNLAINYIRNYRPQALYICFSSGAVYGRGFPAPINENTANNIRVNHVAAEDYYGIVRLNSEAKHRSLKHLKIIDLRLFSYFSRYIDLTDGYFITEIMNYILKNKILITDSVNIVRDYVHPKDLYLIIRKGMNAGRINSAFDVRSSKPVTKKEILDYFSSEYGLKYKIGRDLSHISATGAKNIYYSKYMNAAGIGYKPVFSSMDTIKQESGYILK